MIMQIARQHDGSTEGNTVNIIHAPGTRQFNIDSAALTAFLQKVRFTQSYIDDLKIILLPYASSDEVDDEDWDKYGTAFVDVWLYCEGVTAETLNRELLIGLRRACYEEDQQDSTDECLANWGINPRTITDEEIETDIISFAGWYDDAQFVSVREVNHFCHTLYFRTRHRADLAQSAFAKLPLQSVVTTIDEFHAVQVPTIGIMRQSHIDEILRAMHPVQSSFNVVMP
jgi:hypothetical protein